MTDESELVRHAGAAQHQRHGPRWMLHHPRQPEQDRLHGIPGLALTLWTPEVRREHDAGSGLQAMLESRHDFADPRVVGDCAAVERNVEVGPKEDAPAAEIELDDAELFHGYRD